MNERKNRLTLLLSSLLFLSGCALPAPSTEKQSAKASILARQKWNPVGLFLQKGKMYRFTASGGWKDKEIQAGASGYPDERGYEAYGITGVKKTLFEWSEGWRRFPEGKWFSLICAIGRTEETAFDLGKMIAANDGKSVDYEVQHEGDLYCFANDLSLMYWNNEGQIELEVELQE